MPLTSWHALAAFLGVSVEALVTWDGKTIFERTLETIGKQPRPGLASFALRLPAPYLARDESRSK